MANGRGYLGKISAIISANTGDYVRKLDESANRTRAFARTIQNDLNRAARASSRSIEGILTPLQRFERAIQNAASARLRFRGVDVAVRTIDELRRSIASLEGDREREFAVRVSGLRNITELKNALTDIREEDVDLALNVGGVEGLRRLRQEVEDVNGQQVNIRTERTAEQLDVLIDKFSRLSPERIRQLQIRVESRQIDAAIQKERQLLSLAREIASPLATAAGEFDKLSASVQAEFIPALSRSQNVVQSVADRIEAGGTIGQRAFRRITDEVRQTTQAVERLSEAQRLVQSIGTGRTLRDTSPRQFDALTRAAEQTRRSEALSAQVAAQFGLGDRQRRVADAARAVESASARRESQELDLARARRAGNTEEEVRLQRQVERTVQLEQRRTAELERQLNAQQRQLEQAERFESAVQTGASTPFASFRDPQGRTIAERIRQQAAVREEQERRAEQAADQQRRREAATASLPPVITPPGDEIRGRLGPDIASAAAEFSRLEAATVSVRSQIENLPAPIRAQFIPALRDAVEELVRLQTTNAGADEIARATQRVNELRAGVTRADRAFQAFGGNFRDFADGADFQGAAGRLQFLRQQLLRATGDTTRAEQAVDELAAAFREAASAPGGFRRFAGQLNQIEREAVEAAAAVLRINPQRLAEQLRRAGDVSRGGFGNVQLAVQQAAFAVDDFFSVTGDLSQRIRAAGNNISQLAFILGGTQGLILGVAASIGAQLVTAIVRWVNQTELQQARLSELNNALKSQQAAVDSLAASYARLAQEISRAGATGFERRDAEREDRIQELRGFAEERQRQVATELSPEVADIRGRRAILEESLEGERNLQRRLTIRNQIERNRRQEQAAVARGVPAPDAASVRDQLIAAEQERVRQAQVRLNRARLRADLGGVPPVGEDVATIQAELNNRRADLAARQAAAAATTRREQLSQLRDALSNLESQRERVVVSGARTDEIDAAIDDVTTTIRRIEANLAPAVQRVVEQVTRQSLSIAATLEDGSRLISDSLGDSFVARDIRRSIRATAEEVSRLQTAASNAATPEEARDAQAALTRERRAADELRRAAQQFSIASAREPQRLFSSVLERVQANLQQAGAPQGILARRARELTARREALVQDLDSENPFVRRRADRALPAVDAQIRQVEAATLALRTFADGLNRASQAVQSDFDAARQDADSARRRDIGFSTQQSRAERAAREADLSDQRDAERRGRTELDKARARLESDVIERGAAIGVDDPFQRIRDINEALASGGVEAFRQPGLIEERARIEASIQDLVDEFEQAAQAISDVSARRREVSQLAAEGRQLAITPAQRAGEDLARQLEALRIAFALQAEQTTGLIDQSGLRQAQDRVFGGAVRQQAPLLAQFSDEVFNALLQGPSRAALQATDASTLEGQRELNRLLRGDDPARDVNLLELQRQTAELEKLVELAQNGPQVAN